MTPVEGIDELLRRRRVEWLDALAAFNYDLALSAMALMDYALEQRLILDPPQAP